MYGNKRHHLWPIKDLFTCSGAPLLTRCHLPSASMYVMAVRLSTGLKGRKCTSVMPSLAYSNQEMAVIAIVIYERTYGHDNQKFQMLDII